MCDQGLCHIIKNEKRAKIDSLYRLCTPLLTRKALHNFCTIREMCGWALSCYSTNSGAILSTNGTTCGSKMMYLRAVIIYNQQLCVSF